MKWFWKHCGRREDASLLAAEILSGDEKIAVERHLAECAECRAHYNELSSVTAPFTGWEKNYSCVEASPRMRTHWAKAVKQAAATPSDTAQPATSDLGFFEAVWRELICPSRYAWSGLAALWVAMLVVNAQLSHHPAGRASTSPQEIFQAWEEQKRAIAEWNEPSVIVRVAPAYIPRPRSQRDQDWAAI